MLILHTVLAVTGWSVFALVLVAGLALSLLGLFGSWIILADVVIAYVVTGFSHFSIVGMVILLGLAILGEVIEAAAAGVGAAKFGGGKGAMVAAMVGCIAGAILGSPFMFVVGAVIGACLGAFVGATLYEIIVTEKQAGAAAFTGLGAALGKVAGMLAKFFISLVMIVVIVLDIWVF